MQVGSRALTLPSCVVFPTLTLTRTPTLTLALTPTRRSVRLLDHVTLKVGTRPYRIYGDDRSNLWLKAREPQALSLAPSPSSPGPKAATPWTWPRPRPCTLAPGRNPATRAPLSPQVTPSALAAYGAERAYAEFARIFGVATDAFIEGGWVEADEALDDAAAICRDDVPLRRLKARMRQLCQERPLKPPPWWKGYYESEV